MDEHAQNIEVLQGNVAELQENRQNLNCCNGLRNKERMKQLNTPSMSLGTVK
jgi:hypothetical protein